MGTDAGVNVGLAQCFPCFEVCEQLNEEEETITPLDKPEASDGTQTREPLFWVSVSRRTKFRRLHVHGGCQVSPRNVAFRWKRCGVWKSTRPTHGVRFA